MTLNERIRDAAGGNVEMYDWADEVLMLKKEIKCLLLAIKYYDLADMRNEEVDELLENCKKGIIPPLAAQHMNVK